jgi:SAM-dependent methyltransferase
MQKRTLDSVFGHLPANVACLQFAPDPITPWLQRMCASVVTADLNGRGAAKPLDICAIDQPDHSFDLVYASHVLEHVADDDRALREIVRVLRPGGWAVLPVPIVAERTVEYPSANPAESGHVRATGWDYFDRYRQVFEEVMLYRSTDFPDNERDQLWVYEDRSGFPTAQCPLRPGMAGARHEDAVPVCRAAR